MVISNTGGVNINNLFFVDLYIDPTTTITPGTIAITITESVGYVAIIGLAENTSQVITITTQSGFMNSPETHLVYGMVDSTEEINEYVENNNISTPQAVDFVTPANTPYPTPTFDGSGTNTISGIIRINLGSFVPHERTTVRLINGSSVIVNQTFSDENGFYEFLNVPDGIYTIVSCATVDNVEYTGVRNGISVPPSNLLANVYMLEGSCSSP